MYMRRKFSLEELAELHNFYNRISTNIRVVDPTVQVTCDPPLLHSREPPTSCTPYDTFYLHVASPGLRAIMEMWGKKYIGTGATVDPFAEMTVSPGINGLDREHKYLIYERFLFGGDTNDTVVRDAVDRFARKAIVSLRSLGVRDHVSGGNLGYWFIRNRESTNNLEEVQFEQLVKLYYYWGMRKPSKIRDKLDGTLIELEGMLGAIKRILTGRKLK